MKELFVNEIIEQNGITHGIAGEDRLVKKNLYVMYPKDKVTKIMAIFSGPVDASYFFEGFCQYVVYVQYQPGIGLSMKISDFKGDTDLALDEYRTLQVKGWSQTDIDKIMGIIQRIAKNKKDWAKITVQPLHL
jgi:hypothetical protein